MGLISITSGGKKNKLAASIAKKLAAREAKYYTFGGTDCSYVHVQMPPTGHYTELEIESKVLIRQISLSG